MKKTELLKFAGTAFLSLGLVVGCASDTTEEPAPSTETASTSTEKDCGPSAAAKNAIYSAKIKQARANKLGYEWRDTGKMIKDAEKAAAGCDNDKAVKLAKMAAEQAEDAIAQYNSEQERYAENHGSVTAGSGSSGSSAAPEAEATYIVQNGDNLWNISGTPQVYGNPYQWPLIYKANAAKIKDADLIYPGQIFNIPNATGAEVDAAINHAKTRGAWTVGESEKSDLDYVLGFK